LKLLNGICYIERKVESSYFEDEPTVDYASMFYCLVWGFTYEISLSSFL